MTHKERLNEKVAQTEKILIINKIVEFLGVWERINNPEFNSLEFEGIMKEAGLNLSGKEVTVTIDGKEYTATLKLI